MVSRGAIGYRYQDVLTTVANLLSATEQVALLHPYPLVAERAHEAVPVMREALLVLSHKPCSKNEALNAIARIPTRTKGGQAAIPTLRTPITSGHLDRVSAIHSCSSARELCALGRNAAALSGATDDDLLRWEWVRRAIDHLEPILKRVNFEALTNMSAVAASYPFKEPVHE